MVDMLGSLRGLTHLELRDGPGLKSLTVHSRLDHSLGVSAIPFGLERLVMKTSSPSARHLLLASSKTPEYLRPEHNFPHIPTSSSFPRLLTLSANCIHLEATTLLPSCPNLHHLTFRVSYLGGLGSTLALVFSPLHSLGLTGSLGWTDAVFNTSLEDLRGFVFETRRIWRGLVSRLGGTGWRWSRRELSCWRRSTGRGSSWCTWGRLELRWTFFPPRRCPPTTGHERRTFFAGLSSLALSSRNHKSSRTHTHHLPATRDTPQSSQASPLYATIPNPPPRPSRLPRPERPHFLVEFSFVQPLLITLPLPIPHLTYFHPPVQCLPSLFSPLTLVSQRVRRRG